MNLNILFYLIFSGFHGFASESPPAPETIGLNWKTCIQEAKEANFSLKEAERAVLSARQTKRSREGSFFPQIHLSADYDRTGSETSISENYAHAYSYGVSVHQFVFDGFKTQGQVDAAEASLNISKAQEQEALINLSRDLRREYAEHLFAQQLIVLQRANIQRREQNVDIVRIRYEGGREDKGSYLSSEASLLNAKFDLRTAENDLVFARKELANMLGRKKASQSMIVGRFFQPELPALPGYEVLQRHPSYLRALAQLESSHSNLRQAKGDFWPSLSLSASALKTGDSWPPENTNLSAGVSLTYNLFSGGQDLADIRASQESRKESELATHRTFLELQAGMLEAYQRLQESLNKLDVDRKFVEANQIRADVARTQYTQGLTTFQEWDNNENTFVESQHSYLRSQRDTDIAWAQWRRSLGLEIEESLP